MKIGQTLHVKDELEWRSWLIDNHVSQDEIWLLFPNQTSNISGISYNQAVEQALCFGWIDSIAKRINEDFSTRRFSRRRPKSKYSRTNLERLRGLVDKGVVTKEIADDVRELLQVKFIISPDISNRLRSDPETWSNFQNFSEAYKRIRIGHIEDARKDQKEFQKRLEKFVDMTRRNKLLLGSYGIIEK